MQHIVGSGHALEHIVEGHHIAPDDLNRPVIQIVFQKFLILFTFACKQPYVETVPACKEFLEAGKAHISGGPGHKYSFFHTFIYFSQDSGFCGDESFHT